MGDGYYFTKNIVSEIFNSLNFRIIINILFEFIISLCIIDLKFFKIRKCFFKYRLINPLTLFVKDCNECFNTKPMELTIEPTISLNYYTTTTELTTTKTIYATSASLKKETPQSTTSNFFSFLFPRNRYLYQHLIHDL